MKQLLAILVSLFVLCCQSVAQDTGKLCQAVARANKILSSKLKGAGGSTCVTNGTISNMKNPSGQQLRIAVRRNHLIDYKSDSYQAVSIKTGGALNHTDECLSINRHYCFKLSKKKSANNWVISNVSFDSRPDLDTGRLGFGISARRPSQKEPYKLIVECIGDQYIDVATLADSSNVMVSELDTSSPIIKMIFDITLKSTNNKNAFIAHSELKLDSEHYYLPVSFKQTAESEGMNQSLQSNWTNEFKDGYPARIYSVTRTTLKSGNAVNSDIESISDQTCDYGPVAAHEFTLSAFGFPEPPGLPEHRTGWPTYVWALIVAGICATIIVAVRWRRSRA